MTTDAYAAEAARHGNDGEGDVWLELRLTWSFLGRQVERVLDDLAP